MNRYLYLKGYKRPVYISPLIEVGDIFINVDQGILPRYATIKLVGINNLGWIAEYIYDIGHPSIQITSFIGWKKINE